MDGARTGERSMTEGKRTKFYLVAGIDANGGKYVERAKRPAHEIGDAKYFPHGLPNLRWVLRPMTATDMIEGVSYSTGLRLLIRQIPHIGRLYNVVELSHRFRRNTVANAEMAYRQLCEQRPEYHGFVLEMEALSREAAEKVRQEGARAA